MTLDEIIETVKSNKPVDTEDMIYAILMLDSLWFFEKRAIRDLADAKRGIRKAMLNGDPLFQEKESFRRTKISVDKNPKEWMGWNNDPKNPDYQNRKELGCKILEKVMNKNKSEVK